MISSSLQAIFFARTSTRALQYCISRQLAGVALPSTRFYPRFDENLRISLYLRSAALYIRSAGHIHRPGQNIHRPATALPSTDHFENLVRKWIRINTIRSGSVMGFPGPHGSCSSRHSVNIHALEAWHRDWSIRPPTIIDYMTSHLSSVGQLWVAPDLMGQVHRGTGSTYTHFTIEYPSASVATVKFRKIILTRETLV